MAQGSNIILQFGTGRFLRAFIEVFVQESNDAGNDPYRVIAVQSTPGPRATLINESTNGYPVCVRGIEEGETIDKTIQVKSLSRAIVAATEWNEVLAVARDPKLTIITSNTTEAAYALDPSDVDPNGIPPQSYPAKLCRVLLERFTNDLSPLTLAPCELVEGNGMVLRGLVLEQAIAWGLDDAFTRWVHDECVWLSSMVDRMVVAPKEDDPLADNELSAVTEPFSLWVIQQIPGREVSFFNHPNISLVSDIDASFLRKVRILNGAHTGMVAKFLPQGFRTVRDVMQDADARDWVRGLIFEEIVPCIVTRTETPARFAFQTIERLSNPFFEHKLADISMGHATKVTIRLQSSYDDYRKIYGEEPQRLKDAIGQDITG
jgi:tagaturonate reductase